MAAIFSPRILILPNCFVSYQIRTILHHSFEALKDILYAFADINAKTGEIKFTDAWADEQKHYLGDSWDEQGTNLYGCLKQIYPLKLKNRNLKVLSVGGWTYSQAGHFKFVTSPTSRDNFVKSGIKLIEDHGSGGL
ncbi:glycoside hydrolase family 18 protein [Moniliophthora roreri]|nr:glycoside hydrolase family 18 protein [Moniliophthora roreri]